jgi:hypothetical protein
MKLRKYIRISYILAVLLLIFVTAPLTPLLHAEDSRNGSSASGFSLHKPRIFFGGHIGFSMPRADSDLFGMVTRELTLNTSDFRAATFGGDFGVPFASHFAAVVSFDYSRSSTNSESRGFVESNGDPIVQTTRLSQVPVTATIRYYPMKMGESVGSYAWMPARLNPYIGGGVGVLHYNFSQSGRFVDTTNLNIFTTSLKSSGFAATEHIAGGIDISLSSLIFVNGEARYSWAKANLGKDYGGFHPIDLAGFRILGGMYFRF